MKNHLCEEDIALVVAELQLRNKAQKHLDDCLSCRQKVREMKDLFAQRREQQLIGAPDWAQQKQCILDRLEPQPLEVIRPRMLQKNRWLPSMIALAASLLIVAGIGIIRFGGDPTQTIATTELTLEEILAETESLLNDDSIPGLWVADPVSNIDDIESLFGNGAS